MGAGDAAPDGADAGFLVTVLGDLLLGFVDEDGAFANVELGSFLVVNVLQGQQRGVDLLVALRALVATEDTTDVQAAAVGGGVHFGLRHDANLEAKYS